jgi:hypoxanthine-DNA glycosylase
MAMLYLRSDRMTDETSCKAKKIAPGYATGRRKMVVAGCGTLLCMARTRPQLIPSHPPDVGALTLSGLAPVAGPGARLLVLGSFPSVASLAAQQYYAHPRNQFWPILSAIWGLQGEQALTAMPYSQRLPIAMAHGLAIWDVYGHCQRQGSLDSAIENAQLNDLASLIARTPTLQGIAHNGGESARHMKLTQALGLPVFKLPSTSPANASWSFERKLAAWREVFDRLGLTAAQTLHPVHP